MKGFNFRRNVARCGVLAGGGQLKKTQIVFASHTGLPGGGELALKKYIRKSALSELELLTTSNGVVWNGLASEAGLKLTVLSSAELNLLGEYFAFAKYLRSRSSETAVVVANSMRVALLLALLPKKYVFIYWVRDGLSQSSVNRRAVWITRIFTLRRVDLCLANSQWTAKSIRDVRPSAKVVVCASPSGVSEDHPASVRDRGPVAGPIRIVYVGRIAVWKGVHIAIEAVRILNDSAGSAKFALDIIGGPVFDDASYFDEIKRMSDSLDYVNMLGHIDNVPRRLSEYDFLFHCSTLPEPFGQVVVQGMNAGLIVFATNHGGPIEVIENGVSGILYEPGSSRDLAQVAARVANEPALIERVSEAAITRAMDFSDESVVARLDRIFGTAREEYIRPR